MSRNRSMGHAARNSVLEDLEPSLGPERGAERGPEMHDSSLEAYVGKLGQGENGGTVQELSSVKEKLKATARFRTWWRRFWTNFVVFASISLFSKGLWVSDMRFLKTWSS